MATNIELKQQIDTDIINKTLSSSVTRTNVGNMGKRGLDYTDQRISETVALSVGPAGPQGNPGPIGPAGLVWRGAWLTGTTYAKDDAAGYSGASYFCISPTSGSTTPDLDPTKWALLASQGAQGIQGPPGNSVLNYKKLIGKLDQSGTNAPIMTIFENTFIGALPTASYTSVGGYIINLPGTNDFNKFYATIGADSSSPQTKAEIIKASNGTQIFAFVRTLNSLLTYTPENNRLNSTPFEIRIYN